MTYKISFHTFGCKCNLYDTQKIASSLSDELEVVEGKMQAPIHVVNTCTVTSSADAQCRNLIRKLDRENVESVIIVIGCSLRRDESEYEKLTSGEHKDIMTPFRELTEEEREMIQERLDIIYEAFIEEVAVNRNLSEQQIRELATGMFYLGKEAKDFGLVDELGTKEDAISYIENNVCSSEKYNTRKREWICLK